MLRNYLVVAFRSLRKQAGYVALNVGGLGLGLACCFLLALFIGQEFAFDRFHSNVDRLQRVLVRWGPEAPLSASTSAGIASQWTADLPEVEGYVRVENFRSPYVRLGAETRKLEGLALADPAFFRVFSFPLLRGNEATALADPGGLVLTETTARQFFGDADPVGQTLVMPAGDEEVTFTVTGVMADVPEASSFRFNAVGSFLLLPRLAGEDALDNFTNSNYRTYLLLRPGASADAVAARLTSQAHAQFSDGDSADETQVLLQPLADVHFGTDVEFNEGSVRDRRNVYLFGAAALLILLIACVNFMNLATARATQRAKEVGVRKALGAERGQLVRQFLAESLVQSAAAIALAFVLALAALPVFNAALGTALTLLSGGVGTIALLVALGLAAGVVAGTYPALYLSGFQPTRVLRGEVSRGQRAVGLRRALIVLQFVVSVFLIVATLTVYRQLHFMQSQALGFDREHVVFLQPPGAVLDGYDGFREALLANPAVVSVARAGGLPGRVGTNRGYNWPGQEGAASGDDGAENGDSFWTAPADDSYVETLGLELVAGRSFSRDVPTDTMDTYVINETAARRLGYSDPQAALNQPFRAWDRPMGTIIGVVRDFHFQGLKATIEPLVLNEIPWYGYVAIRLAPGDPQPALQHVRAVWDRFVPGYAFDYTFLDQDFDRLYKDEEKLGRLFGFFAAVAVFIACLGLFGLAAYAAERRTKEIGVRKVLGATAADVVLLLSREFTALVVVAFGIATPLAYWFTSRWLETFAYRVTLGPAVFAVAGLIAVAIGFTTVSTQALRAASVDPVRALRHE